MKNKTKQYCKISLSRSYFVLKNAKITKLYEGALPNNSNNKGSYFLNLTISLLVIFLFWKIEKIENYI